MQAPALCGRKLVLSAFGLIALGASCADELIAPIEGSVEVEVRNVRAETKIVSLVLSPEGRAPMTSEPAAEQPATNHLFEGVGVGLASVKAPTAAKAASPSPTTAPATRASS